MSGKNLLEIILLIIISLLIIFLIFVMMNKPKDVVRSGINESFNKSQVVLKVKIDNMSVTDMPTPDKYKYRFDINMSFDNDWKEMYVIPVVYLDSSYAICNTKKIHIPHGKSKFNCISTIETGKELVYDCSNDCRMKITKGQVIVVGNYSFRFDGIYSKFMSSDYIAKFYVYDGDVVPRKISFGGTNNGVINNYRTYVKGGWVDISLIPPVERYEPVCTEIKTFGSPENPQIIKNSLGVYIFPAGCNFWNGITPSSSSDDISNTIGYCGDSPLGYATKKFTLEKNYAMC